MGRPRKKKEGELAAETTTSTEPQVKFTKKGIKAKYGKRSPTQVNMVSKDELREKTLNDCLNNIFECSVIGLHAAKPTSAVFDFFTAVVTMYAQTMKRMYEPTCQKDCEFNK